MNTLSPDLSELKSLGYHVYLFDARSLEAKVYSHGDLVAVLHRHDSRQGWREFPYGSASLKSDDFISSLQKRK